MNEKEPVNTGLKYHGNVELKLKIKDKIINFKNHNEGKSDLFRVIAKALSGYSITNEIPVMIDVRTSELLSSSILNKDIYLSGGAYFKDTDTNWKVRFNANISGDDINKNLLTESLTTLYIILKSINADLASMEVDISYFNTIATGGMQALLEWTLYVDNANA